MVVVVVAAVIVVVVSVPVAVSVPVVVAVVVVVLLLRSAVRAADVLITVRARRLDAVGRAVRAATVERLEPAVDGGRLADRTTPPGAAVARAPPPRRLARVRREPTARVHVSAGARHALRLRQAVPGADLGGGPRVALTLRVPAFRRDGGRGGRRPRRNGRREQDERPERSGDERLHDAVGPRA